jgi:hypothetical protein
VLYPFVNVVKTMEGEGLARSDNAIVPRRSRNTPLARERMLGFETIGNATIIVHDRDPGPAFSAVRRTRAQAVYVIEDPVFFSGRMTLAALASKPAYRASTG